LRFLYDDESGNFNQGDKRPYLNNIKEIGLYGKTVNSSTYTKIANLNFTLENSKITRDENNIIKEIFSSVSYIEPS
jgi:hypothetical protein